eukprot:TRINITY_DN6740_c0_g1_i1.p1 TRINITY_DN6740_c0_g1~~TRINITY_DN6740_c0_g1_i1.p1  ORF type:complete len:495 (-),score=83.12 TRINITY_DN6740_c0_g1_i1:28-1512(-)
MGASPSAPARKDVNDDNPTPPPAPARTRVYQRSSTETPVVGVAVIGLGQRMTSLLALLMGQHAGGTQCTPVLKRMYGEDWHGLVEIRAVCDESDVAINNSFSRLSLYADLDLGSVPRFTSHEEMFADTSLDFEWVLIGSKNYLHRDHCIAAFKHGKHVFCEKPLATTIEDCLAIREAEREHNGRLLFATGFVLRHAPFYCKIKELIESQVLGTLISVEATETLSAAHGGYIMRNWRRHRAETGPHILEKCCHDIDILNWLIDSLPSRVASFGGLNVFIPQNKPQPLPSDDPSNSSNNNPVMRHYKSWGAWEAIDPFESDKDTEDNQVAIMEYRNNVRVTFHTNCNTALPERSLLICGTKGTLKGDLIKGDLTWQTIADAARGKEPSLWVRPDGKHDMHGGGDSIIIEDLVRCMDHHTSSAPENRKKEADAGADDAADAADAADASEEKGNLPLPVPKATGEEGFRSAVVCLAIDQARLQSTVVDLEPIWKLFNV